MTGTVQRLLLCALLAASVLMPALARAHLLNMTKVQVTVDPKGQLSVELQIDLKRAAGGGLAYYQLSQTTQPLQDAQVLALLDKLRSAIDLRLVDQRVALTVTAVKLPAVPQASFLDPLNWPMSTVTLQGRLPDLPEGAAAQLTGVFGTGFHFEEPIALSFLDTANGHSMTRWLVTSQLSPVFSLQDAGASRTPPQSTWWEFVRFGYRHIVPLGLDHILFVVGLYLGARGMRSLLILVTTFTVAHSITLGLATLGVLQLNPNIVEPLISASIVWVGVENLMRRSSESAYRPLIVFGFGLIHGMGFAAALSELEVPTGQFLQSIVSFNLGIEAAQLSVIALLAIPTIGLMKSPSRRRYLVVPASLLISATAAFWTLQRLF